MTPRPLLSRPLAVLGLACSFAASCASAPRLPADHPARGDAPAAALAPVGSVVRGDPLPMDELGSSTAASPHAGHTMPAPAPTPHASHGSTP